MTIKQIISDIQFGFDHLDEIVPANRRQGAGIAPVLRYAAALNADVDVKDFVAAAEELGLHPATAKTCFYKGRKGYTSDTPKPKPKAKPAEAPKGAHVNCPGRDCDATIKIEGEPDEFGRYMNLVCPKCGIGVTANPKFTAS